MSLSGLLQAGLDWQIGSHLGADTATPTLLPIPILASIITESRADAGLADPEAALRDLIKGQTDQRELSELLRTRPCCTES